MKIGIKSPFQKFQKAYKKIRIKRYEINNRDKNSRNLSKIKIFNNTLRSENKNLLLNNTSKISQQKKTNCNLERP